MIKHRWNYKTLQELKQALDGLGLYIPFSDDTSVLNKTLEINGNQINNRIVYQPMEGGDSGFDGSPGEQTIKRYNDFARGGPGIIWVEAVPVLPEARSNPRQLYLHKDNLPAFEKLVEDMRAECFKANGRDVCIIIQFTHSGRSSRPQGTHAPIVAHHNAYLESENALPDGEIFVGQVIIVDFVNR